MKRSFEIIMRSLYNVKGNWLPIAVLLGLSLFKFYRLDGGINLGEPDEFIHADVAQNFRFGLIPRFAGGDWFFELPFYPFLGYLVSFVFPGRYLGLRLVSVFFSLLLTFGLYLYLKYKISWRVGLLAALLFIFSPMPIYYSRLGLLDMATAAAAMLFLFCLGMMVEKKSWGWGVATGFLLGIAILIKYSALMYFPLLLGYFFLGIFRLNTLGWNYHNWRQKLREMKYLELELPAVLALMAVFLLVAPLAWTLRQLDPYNFKLQLLTSLGFVRDFWRIQGGELTLGRYGTEIIWWVSWPVFILTLFGLPRILHHWRQWPVFLLGFLLTLVFVLPHAPFYPRYFFPLIPFFAVSAALGLDFLWVALAKHLDPTGLKTLWRGLSLALIGVFLLPSSLEAWQASQHQLVEEVGNYVRTRGKTENPWIFTNYWPNYFGLAAGSERATWLTTSTWDAGAYVKNIDASPLELLEREGGFVVLEQLYAPSPIFIHNRERLEAWRVIQEKYRPVIVIKDSLPNFPHFKTSDNKIFVYEINPE